jgi:hypothetical protein
MRKELFGVFGDATEFEQFRSESEFHAVLEGDAVTVGIRDVNHRLPSRTTTYEDDGAICAIWGEVYHPERETLNAAEWLLDAYERRGKDALAGLNGSYVAVVDDGSDAFVATDPVRTWECYYTDAPGTRTFGTDPTAVADAVQSPSIAPDPLLEFVHLGVALGDRTTIAEIERTPFDGCLHENSTSELRRFVYDTSEFDYVDELARRIENAVERRSRLPGRKGLLLSGGYDSRTILACLPDVDVCYTVGPPDSDEVEVSEQLATQYGVDHETLVADGRYLDVHPETARYGHGIRESVHIHHGAFDSEIDVDTVYHGLLWDTFLRGHFLPEDYLELFGSEIPLYRVDPDPDAATALVEQKFGYISTSDRIEWDCDAMAVESKEYVRRALEDQIEACRDRCDSEHDAIELAGIRNQPTLSFRHHLADNYLEAFVAADTELLDWHLRAPHDQRDVGTLLEAMRRIDPDLLQHRPPNRLFDSPTLNQAQSFLRRKLPFVDSVDSSWPDLSTYYERKQLDERLFPHHPETHDLPTRLKLRVNDANVWFETVANEAVESPLDVLCPQS